MSTTAFLRCLMICAVTSVGVAAHAASDYWRIQEMFSDSSGAVQFIELATTEPNEFLVDNHALTVTSDGVPMTFTLDHNLSGQASTANRTFLVATSGFAALAGSVTPDFTMPSNFINPFAGSIDVDFAGIDMLSFPGTFLPKDGTISLVAHYFSGVLHYQQELNTPTNFAGVTGQINVDGVAQPADFDENGTVNHADFGWWQFGYGISGTAIHSDGDADGDLNTDGDDFLIWQQQLQQPQATATASTVAEPTSGLLAAVLLAGAAAFRRWRRA